MENKFSLKFLEKGQVIPIVVISLFALIAMAALLIDGGMLMAHRRAAQAAADAGALAGAAYLCPNNYDSNTAILVADQYASANITNDQISSSGTSIVTLVSSNTIRVETSVTSPSFFARIFDQFGLTAGAEAEANCSPASIVSGALPFVFPCDPVIDDINEKSEYGYCRVVYGDPSVGETVEENIQWHVDNDKMTILLTSNSVTDDCYDEEDNPDGLVECSDNVVAMGNRGWISLAKNDKRQDIQKYIAGDNHTAVIGIGYWLSSFTGVDTNLYLNHISKITGQDRYVPIYNKQCDKTYPSVECRNLYEFGFDNEKEIRHPGAPGQSNFRISGFGLFRITCVYPTKGNAECPYRNKLISQGKIPNNNSVKSVEGYFIEGTTPEGGGGGPDYKLYTVQLTK